MRARIVLATLLVLVTPAVAEGPPGLPLAPGEVDARAEVMAAARTTQLAFSTSEDRYFRQVLARTVVVRGLQFVDRKCQREFGERFRKIRGKARARLATCLIRMTHAPHPTAPVTSEGPLPRWVRLESDRDQYYYSVEFGSEPDGTLVIAQISMNERYYDGEEGGVIGGIEGEENGVLGGLAGPLPPPPPPPPPPGPPPPQNVAPTVLEAQRLTGERAIQPDDDTKIEILQSGKTKIVGSFKLCIDTAGAVVSVSQLKSTGFPAYDAKLKREIKVWTYAPVMVNGRAVPVCTAVTFIYSQK